MQFSARTIAPAFFLIMAFAAAASAQGVPGINSNKCLAGKTKCVNKKVEGLLQCREKCQRTATACGQVQTACEAKVMAKFDGTGVRLGCFEKLEAKDDGVTPENICTTTDDQAAVEAMVDVMVGGIVGTLEGSPPPTCGDGVLNGAESCDGANLGGETCATLGYATGTLACTAGCGYDVSGCVPHPINTCGNGNINGGEDCDLGNLNGKTCATEGFVGGTLICGAGCVFDTSGCFSTRFVDNGDGTLMDHLTGLQWEKKTGSLGSLVNCSANPCPDPHNVNNAYSWSISGSTPDGGVYTGFLGQLNACQDDGNGISPPTGLTGGFAGHCDWRLPTIIELESLMLGQYPCGMNPCIDFAFSPTGVGESYWSSSTRATHPDIAWAVSFRDGWITFADPKTGTKYVRAVRNGS